MLSMFLTVSYYFYLIWLLVPSFSSMFIITLFALIYIVYIGVIVKKPEISVYCFLILFLFFPKSGENYILIQIKELDITGVSLQLILQSIAAFAICLQLLMRNPVKRKIPKKLKIFCNLFIATYFITLLTTLFYQTQGSYLGVTFAPERVAGGAAFLFSYIFLIGCINFITKTEQIEKIFIIIMAAGFMMVMELILNVYLKLPLPYSDRSVYPGTSNFRSLIYADHLFVATIAFAAIGCTLYFIYSRRKYIFLGAVPWLFLPIISTHQRSHMFGALCVVTLFLLLSTYFVKTKTAYVVTIVVGILASILVLFGGIFLEFLVSALKGQRPDFFISYIDSWASRLGSYARGLDVIYHFFPFGVGPTLMDEFMASPSLPIYFPPPEDWQKGREFFFQIATGQHTTGAHSVFIQFIGEYGLMGGIIELLFIYYCFSNFLSLRRYVKMAKYRHSKPMIISACVFAVLVGIGIQAIFIHTIPYSFCLLFFYLTFLNPDELENKLHCG